MNVTLGILAYNESANIRKAIESLFKQDVFRPRDDAQAFGWDIIVVPNGCVDDTASAAREALDARCPAIVQSGIELSYRVEEVASAGKSNAWNLLVHTYAGTDTDILFLMDADIEFIEESTLRNMLSLLMNSPATDVVVDAPIKDIQFKEKKSLAERLSLRISKDALAGPAGICGQLYCGRYQVLEKIWMPIGLSGEDGFLRAMIATDLFRQPPDNSRILRAEGASHTYETLSDIRSIFHHELRLAIGTALNCYLCWDFLLFATDPRGEGAGSLIKHNMENDPQWYSKLMHNQIRNHGIWVMPRGMLEHRIHMDKKGGIVAGLLHGAFNLAKLVFNLLVLIAANKKIKQGNSIGFW